MNEIENGLYYSDIRSELEHTGKFVGRTSGWSMYPLLRNHRDVIVIEQITREVKKFDVALYKFKDSKYILHRIIGKKDGKFRIRGDNCYTEEYVEEQKILGILTGIFREGKFIEVKKSKGYWLYTRLWHYSYFIRFFIWKLKQLKNKK